jgi:hypothetical protein
MFSLSVSAAVRCTAVVALLLATTGCDSGPTMHPVKGKVVIKGSNASLESGNIAFQSVASPDVISSGYIEEDGSFELYSNQNKPGALEGEHHVLVQPPEVEYGRSKLIPDKYRAFDTSGITKTVAPGENDIVVELDPARAR